MFCNFWPPPSLNVTVTRCKVTGSRALLVIVEAKDVVDDLMAVKLMSHAAFANVVNDQNALGDAFE